MTRGRPGVTLRLPWSPPYDWDDMLAFLSGRAIAGVEHVSGDTYARTFAWEGVQGVFFVAPGRRDELTFVVHHAKADAVAGISARVRGLLDLGADPKVIDAHLSADRVLAPLVAARPGLRVGGCWNGFELGVRAILGQQITVAGARTIAGSLVARCGAPVEPGLAAVRPELTHVFPTAEQLLGADLAGLGVPRSRLGALQALAGAVRRRPQIVEECRSLDAGVEELTSIPGIGPWTAQYIAMRGLREPDAFPASDVALLRAMRDLTGEVTTPASLLRHAEAWRPWRSYAAAHLWAHLRATE